MGSVDGWMDGWMVGWLDGVLVYLLLCFVSRPREDGLDAWTGEPGGRRVDVESGDLLHLPLLGLGGAAGVLRRRHSMISLRRGW